MIADGDSVARNAFRVGLRVDTPLPVPASSGSVVSGVSAASAGSAGRAPAGITQELDPNDILEVQDMAAAIARAEMLLASASASASASRSSSSASSRGTRSGRPDMFDALGRRATDDTAGPATPAPPYASLPTPIPPPSAAAEPVALAAGYALDTAVPVPTPTPLRYLTMPSALPAAEDDAFYHPVGRMRSLADVTLDGYRPEPTLLVRAATRRKRFSWILAAVLLPLLVLAAIAISAAADGPKNSPAVDRARATRVATNGRTALATTSASSKMLRAAASAASDVPALGTPSTPPSPPVFDVNSLPPARGRR